MKALLSISENEKHLHVIYHNFVKCKLKRLDLLLKSENWQLLDNQKFENFEKIKVHNDKVQEIIDHKIEIELYSKQCEHYITNIFKSVSYDEKLEYKSNLLLNLWKENQVTWWSLKNIFSNLNILEILDLVLKFIINIF